MFSTEKELVDNFLVKESRKTNTKIFVELETNYGRPDIVVVSYNKTILNNRVNSYVDVPFDRLHSYALTFLYKKRWIRIENLRDFLNISDRRVEKMLEQLASRGLIEMKNNLIKINKNKDILAINRIKVFEAKLSNWKYVVEQAERHLWFTNESSVLIPALSEETLLKCEELCKMTGIGLSISKDKKIIKKIHTPKKVLINTPLLWEINERLIEESIR